MFGSRQPTGDRGATAVEYGLIVFAIAAAIAALTFAFGGVVVELFTGTCEDLVANTGSTVVCD